jgi:hypothetical protein
MRFTPDVVRGDWILPRLRGGGVVGGIVPRGFEVTEDDDLTWTGDTVNPVPGGE